MRIRLRERDPQTRRWVKVLEQRVSLHTRTQVAPLSLSETHELEVTLFPEPSEEAYRGRYDARVLLGNHPVASTLRKERPDFLMQWHDLDEESESCSCRGRILRDWAGLTEIKVQLLHQPPDRHVVEARWTTVLQAEVYISAGKMEQEVFEALCAEVADYSASMLLDVYGKTFVGLELERRPGETAPIVALHRVRQAIDQMESSLRAIARRPAYRLRGERVREPALVEQAVSDLTLEETCVDPTLALRLPSGGVRFREHVREVATPSYDLPENRMLAGFLHFLTLQTRDLRGRMEREVQVREERREHRSRRLGADSRTWWESEDLPRIAELRGLLDHVEAMARDLAHLRGSPFLPPTPPLRTIPQSTPLIRSHKAYSSAFKVMASHYQSFRVQMDDKHLVLRARSLPVLYEWWCLLEVMRSLRGCLAFGQSEDFGPQSPFRRLAEERDRFVMEFEADQSLDFEDTQGNLVRLRYQPSYTGYRGETGPRVGLLGGSQERSPDIALEVFLGGEASNRPPDVIVVLDAKYSSEGHQVKLDEVKRKYDKIGVLGTGKVLSRQVWAIMPTPAAPVRVARWGGEWPEWASYCTVDNLGFWSDDFDVQSAVVGVVQAQPKMLAGRSPLESLLRLILKRLGIALRG